MIQIVFKDCPPLDLQIDDTPVARRWLDLFRENVRKQPRPVFRDPNRYGPEYLTELAQRANQELGWQWDTSDLSTANTTLMHKDIETFLAQGFSAIPAKYDDLLTEIHFCLHVIQGETRRSEWLQIEWFNDDGVPLTADEYPGKLGLEFGDLRLLNPYVGHIPTMIYDQRDHTNIAQTCRFHDLIRPGVCFVITHRKGHTTETFPWQDYLAWFRQHAPGWLAQHGEETLIKFTGDPVIGRIRNLKDLEYCLGLPFLDIDRVVLS